MGEWNRDASLEKSMLTGAGHRIRGLEGSLAEKRSRRPRFLMTLRGRKARQVRKKRGDEREDWIRTGSWMYGCGSHFTEGCQDVVGKRGGSDGE